MNDLEVIIGVKRLLDSPEKWTKGCLARTVAGIPCDPSADDAVSWCLIGATRRVDPGREFVCSSPFLQHIPYGKTAAYNDHPDTAYKDIVNLINKAYAHEALRQEY